jgi:hypothetical protein
MFVRKLQTYQARSCESAPHFLTQLDFVIRNSIFFFVVACSAELEDIVDDITDSITPRGRGRALLPKSFFCDLLLSLSRVV